MRHRMLLFLLVLLLLGLLAGSNSSASRVTAQGDAQVKWWVFGSGGGSSKCGDVQINATLGQAVTDSAQEGNTTLSSGFWPRILTIVEEFLNFLPVIFH